MVEIDAGDCFNVGVVRRRSTVNSGVVADIGSDPIGGEVHWVGKNGLLPRLKSNVSVSKTRVLELEIWVDGDALSSVAILVFVVKKLAMANVVYFRVGESAIANESRAQGGEERKYEEDGDNNGCMGCFLHLTADIYDTQNSNFSYFDQTKCGLGVVRFLRFWLGVKKNEDRGLERERERQVLEVCVFSKREIEGVLG